MTSVRSSVTVKKNRSAVTVPLMVDAPTRFAVRCNWKSRRSSLDAVSGDRLQEDRETLDCPDVVLLRLRHAKLRNDMSSIMRCRSRLMHSSVMGYSCLNRGC